MHARQSGAVEIVTPSGLSLETVCDEQKQSLKKRFECRKHVATAHQAANRHPELAAQKYMLCDENGMQGWYAYINQHENIYAQKHYYGKRVLYFLRRLQM